jgi:hypothetical protein
MCVVIWVVCSRYMCLLLIFMSMCIGVNVFKFLFPLVRCYLVEGHECICCGMSYVFNFYF